MATCTAGVSAALAAVAAGGWVTNASVCCVNTVKGVLVARANTAAVATSVYPLPGRSTRRSVKVAMPFTAPTVVVPVSVAAPGFSPSATVTASVAPETVLPDESCTATWTGGDKVTPDSTVGGGCVTNAKAPRVTWPGDQLGWTSSPGLLVRRVGPEPSALIT